MGTEKDWYCDACHRTINNELKKQLRSIMKSAKYTNKTNYPKLCFV